MLSVAASAARTREPKSFSTTAARRLSAGATKKDRRPLRGASQVRAPSSFDAFFDSFFFKCPESLPSLSFHFILSSLSTRIVSYYRSFWGLFHFFLRDDAEEDRRRQQRRRKRRPTGRRGKHPLRCSPARTQESPKIHYSLGFWIFEISFCLSDLI